MAQNYLFIAISFSFYRNVECKISSVYKPLVCTISHDVNIKNKLLLMMSKIFKIKYTNIVDPWLRIPVLETDQFHLITYCRYAMY